MLERFTGANGHMHVFQFLGKSRHCAHAQGSGLLPTLHPSCPHLSTKLCPRRKAEELERARKAEDEINVR